MKPLLTSKLFIILFTMSSPQGIGQENNSDCNHLHHLLDVYKEFENSNKDTLKSLFKNIEISCKDDEILFEYNLCRYRLGIAYRTKVEKKKALEKLIASADEIGHDEISFKYRINLISENDSLIYEKDNLELFNGVVRLVKNKEDSLYLAYAHYYLGGFYSKLMKYDNALEYYKNTLRISEEIGSKKLNTNSYSRMSFIFRQSEELDKAIEYGLLAESNLPEEYNKWNEYLIYSNLFHWYYEKGNIDKTKEYTLKASNLYPDDFMVRYSWANLYEDKGDLDSALFHLKFVEDQLLDDVYELDNYYGKLGKLEHDMGNYRAAAKTFQKAIGYIEKYPHGDFKNHQLIYHHALKNYLHTIDQGKVEYLARIRSLNDSLVVLNTKNEISSSRVEFETERIEFENQKLKHANEVQLLKSQRQKAYLMFGSIVLLLMVMIGYLLHRQSKRNQANYKSELEKNDRIELLLHELDHRSQGQLNLAINLLKGQIANSKIEAVKTELDLSTNRLMSLSSINKHLNINITETESLEELISSIGEDLIFNSQKEVELDAKVDDLKLTKNQLTYVVLIANELILNSIKYAKNFDEKLRISLKLSQNESDDFQLDYADNGGGKGEEVIGTGKGVKLIKDMVLNMRGTCKEWNENGYQFQMNFPPSKVYA